jgi:hypothetical protein
MITTSNSPAKGSGTPNQLLDVLLHTIAMSGLSRVRTELFQLLIIPFFAHHPVKANRQFARQGVSPRTRSGGTKKGTVNGSPELP